MTTRNGKVQVKGRRRRRRETPLPARPYRASAVLYAVLSLLIVGIALVTGGDLAQALVVAALFFLAATAYSWWRFRQRLRDAAREGDGSR